MSADRPVGAAGVAGMAAIGLCCGLPVLLSLGAGATIAGLGVRSWLLAAAGLIVMAIAAVRLRRHRACKLTASADQQGDTRHAKPDRTR
ncbi:MAG TPA: hypothetical protein VF942_17360 [Acidimicrobiales bacterium]